MHGEAHEIMALLAEAGELLVVFKDKEPIVGRNVEAATVPAIHRESMDMGVFERYNLANTATRKKKPKNNSANGESEPTH